MRKSISVAMMGGALLALFGAGIVEAATFNILNGDVAGLIAAIQAANAGGGSNTINLAPNGTYTLTAVADSGASGFGCCGSTGLPYIASQITIHGNGATIQRSSATGTPLFGILAVKGNGNLSMDGVTLTGGSADPNAPSNQVGGLGIDGGTVSVQGVTITQNAAMNAPFWASGGILNFCGNLTMLNSTVTYNTNSSAYGGGGIMQFSFNCSPVTHISFSTIFENQNAPSGSGFGGRGDSISNNFGASNSLIIKNSILANPTRGLGSVCNGTFPVSDGHNIAGDASCGFTAAGDMNSTNPLLGPTVNNGGPTPTDFPATNSPAIGAVPVGYCTDVFGNPVTTDQRGFLRKCPTTIGSVEFEGLYHVCLLYDPTMAAPSGATDPIKLQLCDANGNDLSSSTIVLHATGITQTSTSVSGPVQSPGNANPDSDFRFDSTLGPTGGYIFNLSTKGLATGSYDLNFTVTGDSFVYAAPFQVK